jgi:adenylate kinase
MTIHDGNDRAAWLHGPSDKCSVPPENNPGRWRLVLLGAPGVGKGTQADLLHERFGACHLSTGDVFRAAARNGLCPPTPAMTLALEFMRRGELVPDATVWEMVRERAGCLRCGGGFLLDGFPRTLAQAEVLHRALQDEHIALDAVVNYELPLSEIIGRLSGRRVCEECKAVTHVSQLTASANRKCQHCGGRLVQREDDRPESVAVRMDAYERSTAPLIKYYKDHGLLVPVAATGSPEVICGRTVIALAQRTARTMG